MWEYLRASRSTLEVSGDIWGPWGVSGSIWGYLGVSGSIWEYLVVSGSIWWYLGCLGVSGSIWEYLGVLVGIWGYVVLSGSIWLYLGVSGSTWEQQVVSVSLRGAWEHRRIYSRAVMPASAGWLPLVAVQLGRSMRGRYRWPPLVAVQLGRHSRHYRPGWTAMAQIARSTHTNRARNIETARTIVSGRRAFRGDERPKRSETEILHSLFQKNSKKSE